MKLLDLFRPTRVDTHTGEAKVALGTKVLELLGSNTVRWLAFLLCWKLARAARITMPEVEAMLGDIRHALADGLEYLAALMALKGRIGQRLIFRADAPPEEIVPARVPTDATEVGTAILDSVEFAELPRPSIFPIQPRREQPEPPPSTEGIETGKERVALAHSTQASIFAALDNYEKLLAAGLTPRVAADIASKPTE